MATIQVVDDDDARLTPVGQAQFATKQELPIPDVTDNETGAASQPAHWLEAPASAPAAAAPRARKLTFRQPAAYLWAPPTSCAARLPARTTTASLRRSFVPTGAPDCCYRRRQQTLSKHWRPRPVELSNHYPARSCVLTVGSVARAATG